MSYGQTSSQGQQQSNSGVQPQDRTLSSAIGTQSLEKTGTLGQQYSNTPIPTASIDKYGLLGTEGQNDSYVSSLVSQALNKVSGSWAANGRVQPNNVGALAGSAIQNTLPQLLPQIQSNYQYAQQLPYYAMNQNLGFAGAAGQLAPGLLGSTSSGTNKSFGFGGAVSGSSSSSGADGSKSAMAFGS